MTTIKRTNSSYQVLDPAALGRPIHLLRNFSNLLREELMGMLRANLNRRYRAHFEVGDVTMSQVTDELQHSRWLTYGCTLGRIGFAIERNLALAVLAYRYDATDRMPAEGNALPPETASEERLVRSLGQQLVDLLAKCIEMCGGAPNRDAEPISHVLAPLALGATAQASWLIKATIVELACGVRGDLYLTLDEAWMARLLTNIAPLRKKPHDGIAIAPVAANELPLKIVARLLQKEIPLGNLLDMRIGEVIPISLSDADVLIENSRLFTATVAEHKGKLCLTGFMDVE